MTDIISVETADFGGEPGQAVSARKLYEYLGARANNYNRWFNSHIIESEYAIEGQDYIIIRTLLEEARDCLLSIDFAKTLSMMVKTPKGNEVRQYFIKIEKAYKKMQTVREVSTPQTYLEALEALVEKQKLVETQGIKLVEAEKKIEKLTHTGKLYTATEIAKELGMRSAAQLNSILEEKAIQYKINNTWVLRSWFADKGYDSIKQVELENGRVAYHRMWTQAGREFLLDKFSDLIHAKNTAIEVTI